MSESKIAILTGPNFAIDIARGLPSASTLASDPETGKFLMENLTARNLRLYFTSDMVSAQIGGAIKTSSPLPAAFCHGLNLGEAHVPRLLRTLPKLPPSGISRRKTRHTMGQCGVGDIMLTCSSIVPKFFVALHWRKANHWWNFKWTNRRHRRCPDSQSRPSPTTAIILICWSPKPFTNACMKTCL